MSIVTTTLARFWSRPRESGVSIPAVLRMEPTRDVCGLTSFTVVSAAGQVDLTGEAAMNAEQLNYFKSAIERRLYELNPLLYPKPRA